MGGSTEGLTGRSTGRSTGGSTEDSIGGSIGDFFNVRPPCCAPGSMFVYAIAGRVEAHSEQRRGAIRE